MVQTRIELTEEQMSALKKIARTRRMTLSKLVQEGVETVLRSEAPKNSADMKRRALDIAGRFHSGIGDLSKRHDDYLAETIAP